MERVRFIAHKGAKILKVDLSHSTSVEENIEVLDQARKIISMQPKRSLLLLTDVTKAAFNPKGITVLKEWSSSNTPYLQASAVLGVGGIYRIIYEALVKVVKREIVCFDTEEEALDWLASR